MRDWLAIRTHATPEAAALRAAGPVGTELSYAELDDRVETLAGRLAGAGVGVGDPVAICASTRPEFVTVVHAVQRLGAVLVPIDARLTTGEIEARLDRLGIEAVVCEEGTESAVVDATDDEAAVLSLDEPTAGASALSETRPEPFDLPAWELEEPLAVLFTSGTTGEPKGVVLTLGNVLASATASAFRLGLCPDDCWHVPLPMHHMGGLAPVYRSVLYGTSLSLQEAFDPEATLEALAAADATAVSLVPTMLDRLLDAGELPELRFALLGGAPCPPELLERAQDRGVPVAPTYGMTEAASQIATARPETARTAPESVGHPLMFAEVTVVDEAGVPCEPGEPGELVVSGAMITPGYLDDEVTNDRFVNGGLLTGDRGYRDESGRVYVLGRVDDVIVTGGENVDPEEVSARLREHPAVDDCAVVGIDDDEWGQRVAALVVPTDGTTPSQAELETHCREGLAGYKRPRTIGFADRLPRTASGTVDRAAVADRLADGAE
jgi:O-succinylbenzoic acid--CoA ligase